MSTAAHTSHSKHPIFITAASPSRRRHPRRSHRVLPRPRLRCRRPRRAGISAVAVARARARRGAVAVPRTPLLRQRGQRSRRSQRCQRGQRSLRQRRSAARHTGGSPVPRLRSLVRDGAAPVG